MNISGGKKSVFLQLTICLLKREVGSTKLEVVGGGKI